MIRRQPTFLRKLHQKSFRFLEPDGQEDIYSDGGAQVRVPRTPYLEDDYVRDTLALVGWSQNQVAYFLQRNRVDDPEPDDPPPTPELRLVPDPD